MLKGGPEYIMSNDPVTRMDVNLPSTEVLKALIEFQKHALQAA